MTTRIASKQTSLKRRIRQFYLLLGQREFARCYQMIDPQVRQKPSSVTLFQYQNALAEFAGQVGSIKVFDIDVALHLGEVSKLYAGRDFAVGKTTWADRAGEQHTFSERWVLNGRAWYTRCTVLIVPRSFQRKPSSNRASRAGSAG